MSADATRQNIKIRRGDGWGQGFVLTCYRDGDGNPLDITGAEIRLSIRDTIVTDPTATDVSDPPIVQITSPAVVGGPGGINVTDGPLGKASLVLTPQQTKLLEKRRYMYDVEVIVTTGPFAGVPKTVLWGDVEALPQFSLSV